MTIEFGHWAFILLLTATLTQVILSFLWTTRRAWTYFIIFKLALISIVIFALVHAFIVSDFSLLLVAQHSHSLQPLIYKIAALWGNHEGSMVMWIFLMLGAEGVFLKLRRDQKEIIATLMPYLWLQVFFLLYSILTANPFWRVLPAPMIGQGLNPLLQDLSMSYHPPLLYIGYVGTLLPFCWAAGLWKTGNFVQARDTFYAWIRISWGFLTLGIATGSFWAYYELGWGGWWFWDPVENASLLPWLLGAVMLHLPRSFSATQEARALLLVSWFQLLMTLTGVLLVRSGAVMSVHTFAHDMQRGVWLLALVVGVLIWGVRLCKAFFPINLTTAWKTLSQKLRLSASMLLLSVLGVVMVGTFAPLVANLWGETITVAPAFYERGLALFLLLIVMGMLWSMARFKTAWRMWGAHIGLLITLVGVLTASLGEKEIYFNLAAGEKRIILGQTVHLKEASFLPGANYFSQKVTIELNGITLTPERRLYNGTMQLHHEVALGVTRIGSVRHLTLLHQDQDGRWSLRLLYHPGGLWIWLGGSIIFLCMVMNRRQRKKGSTQRHAS